MGQFSVEKPVAPGSVLSGNQQLARLLALNAERAAAERAAGLTAIPEDEDDDIDEAAVAE